MSTTKRFAVNALSRCREILTKDPLALPDLNGLLSNVEFLCAFAITNMAETYTHGQAKSAIETMGMIFLVLDTLYCVAEVLGARSVRPLRRPLMLNRIRDVMFSPRKTTAQMSRYSYNVYVARTLYTTLGFYR